MESLEGIMVEVNDHRLHVRIRGEGAPSVVIISGLGSPSAEWWYLQDDIAEQGTVVTFDRAGYGFSDYGPLPRTNRRISEELFELLERAGISPPYLLIGHSAGGLMAQYFARMYPGLVGAMVLVDSLSPEAGRIRDLDAPEYQKRASIPAIMKELKMILEMDDDQFVEIVPSIMGTRYDNLTGPVKDLIIQQHLDRKMYRTMLHEMEVWEHNLSHVNEEGPFPPVPLKVICRDTVVMIDEMMQMGIPEEEAGAAESLWAEINRNLAGLSPKGDFLVASGAGHEIHLSKPRYIVDAVSDLIEDLKA
jgi:pimeloyl-ACP methyl ester carboxylesterase